MRKLFLIKKLKIVFIFSLVFCSNSSSPLFIKNLTPLMLNHKILCSNEGIIYGGSRGGLFQFNTKNLKFTTYNQPGNLDFFDINTIFLDIKGYLWLGSNDNQPNIQIFNTNNNTHFKTIHLPEVGIQEFYAF